MLLLLLNYVVLRALWKTDVHLIITLVYKSVYYNSQNLQIPFYLVLFIQGQHVLGPSQHD